MRFIVQILTKGNWFDVAMCYTRRDAELWAETHRRELRTVRIIPISR